MDLHTISRLNRYKAIVLALIKYGFGDIIDRLDLPEKLFPSQVKKHLYWNKSTWERIPLVLAELGPTFIKFGQLLSLRPDLIPASLAKELSLLQDEVPPEPFSSIQKHIEKSLQTENLYQVFSEFETEPIAAASLAQVHRAILKNDQTVVAVKVQRPNIKNIIRDDLNIMAGLAKRAHERIESLRPYELPQLVKELKHSLLNELDFEREGRNIRLAQSNFSQIKEVYLPKVYSELTTTQILTMELIKGSKLKNDTGLLLSEKKKLGQICVRATMKQILEDGFFHADPHPGNILILPDGKFSLLDWGMVGRITPETRLKLISLIEAIIDKDSETVLNVFLNFTRYSVSLSAKDSLQRELMDIIDDYHSLPLKDINIGQLLTSIANIIKSYYIPIRPELAMMIKAMVTSEGSARILYPELNIVSEAEPYIRKLVIKKYSPQTILHLLRRNLSNLWQMQKDLPTQLNLILDKIQHDQLSIGFEHKKLEGLSKTLDRVANRLTLGIITAAMIIGSSMIITTGVKPFIFGYPALGLVGYLLSAFIGIWLAFDIIRKRRM